MTITINGSYALDETTGAQDQDIAAGSLPSAFSTRLTALSLTPIEAAASASNFIAVSGSGTVTSLGLFDINGGVLNGDASGVFALNGNQIFLYVDSANPNIVLGREGTGNAANPSGTVALAVYLEPNAALTSAKMYSAIFEPLRHNLNGLDPDDRVDLGNNLKVGATSVTTFSFANAPSGDNLFMAFGSTSSAIVVTGLNPNNNNTGSDLDKSGGFSSVNSGQGGGGTTLGTGIQGIGLGDGMIFTYVTGMNASFLASAAAGGLDQNEADSEQNIAFTGLNSSNGASFKVVKVSKNVTCDVNIKALSTANQSGVQYVDGLGDDGTAITINAVLVNGAARSFTTNANGSVTVTGIAQDDVISFTTSAAHNRVQIVNASAAGGPNFSLGSFGLSNTNNDLTAVGQAVDFDDDGPNAALAATQNTAIADESVGTDANDANAADEVGNTPGVLIAGNPAVIGWAQATVVSTSGTTFGRDGGSAGLSFSLTDGVDSGLDTTDGTSIFLFKEGNNVVGRSGADATAAATGQAIFALSITNAGVLTVEQYDSMKHLTSPNSFDELAQISSGILFVVNTAADNDNDPSTAQVDIAARFGFQDDGPKASLSLNAGVFVTVDESVGTDASDPNADDETAAGAPAGAVGYKVVTGAALFTQSSDVGEDDEGATTAFSFVVNAAATGLQTAAGQTITLVSVDSTHVKGVFGAGGANTAFTIAIDATTGDVTLAQFVALDQPTNPLTYDEAVSIQAGSLSVRLTATDGDSDVSSATGATVDLGPRLSFEDDGPKLAIDDASTDNGALNVGNMVGASDSETFDFDAGSDASGGFCITDAPDTGGYGFRYVNGSGGTVTGPTNSIVGALNGTDLYSLSVNASGTYTFTLLSALPGTQLALDTNDIKAGGPDTNFIDVGVLQSPDFVKISGFFNGAPAAVNESNLNVGVKNGNLDSGEAIRFSLFTDDDNDPMTAAVKVDITSITVGTKTAGATHYTYTLSNDGVNLAGFVDVPLTVAKNGNIVASAGGALFDTVTINSMDNAVKIGLRGIFINIQPEDQTLDFTAILKDGDADETAGVDFQAFIDGNNDGMIDSLGPIFLSSPGLMADADLAARFVDAAFGAVAPAHHFNGDLALYHLV